MQKDFKKVSKCNQLKHLEADDLHYRMYKAGKKWLFASLFSLSLAGAVVITTGVDSHKYLIHADSVAASAATASQSSASSSQSSSASSSTSDQQAESDYQAQLVQYQQSETEYQAELVQYNSEEALYQAQVAQSDSDQASYSAAESQYASQESDYQAELAVYQSNEAAYEASMAQYSTSEAAYQTELAAYSAAESTYAGQMALYSTAETSYQTALSEYDSEEADYQAQLAAYNSAVQSASDVTAQNSAATATYNAAMAEYQAAWRLAQTQSVLYRAEEDNLAAYQALESNYGQPLQSEVDQVDSSAQAVDSAADAFNQTLSGVDSSALTAADVTTLENELTALSTASANLVDPTQLIQATADYKTALAVYLGRTVTDADVYADSNTDATYLAAYNNYTQTTTAAVTAQIAQMQADLQTYAGELTVQTAANQVTADNSQLTTAQSALTAAITAIQNDDTTATAYDTLTAAKSAYDNALSTYRSDVQAYDAVADSSHQIDLSTLFTSNSTDVQFNAFITATKVNHASVDLQSAKATVSAAQTAYQSAQQAEQTAIQPWSDAVVAYDAAVAAYNASNTAANAQALADAAATVTATQSAIEPGLTAYQTAAETYNNVLTAYQAALDEYTTAAGQAAITQPTLDLNTLDNQITTFENQVQAIGDQIANNAVKVGALADLDAAQANLQARDDEITALANTQIDAANAFNSLIDDIVNDDNNWPRYGNQFLAAVKTLSEADTAYLNAVYGANEPAAETTFSYPTNPTATTTSYQQLVAAYNAAVTAYNTKTGSSVATVDATPVTSAATSLQANMNDLTDQISAAVKLINKNITIDPANQARLTDLIKAGKSTNGTDLKNYEPTTGSAEIHFEAVDYIYDEGILSSNDIDAVVSSNQLHNKYVALLADAVSVEFNGGGVDDRTVSWDGQNKGDPSLYNVMPGDTSDDTTSVKTALQKKGFVNKVQGADGSYYEMVGFYIDTTDPNHPRVTTTDTNQIYMLDPTDPLGSFQKFIEAGNLKWPVNGLYNYDIVFVYTKLPDPTPTTEELKLTALAVPTATIDGTQSELTPVTAATVPTTSAIPVTVTPQTQTVPTLDYTTGITPVVTVNQPTLENVATLSLLSLVPQTPVTVPHEPAEPTTPTPPTLRQVPTIPGTPVEPTAPIPPVAPNPVTIEKPVEPTPPTPPTQPVEPTEPTPPTDETPVPPTPPIPPVKPTPPVTTPPVPTTPTPPTTPIPPVGEDHTIPPVPGQPTSPTPATPGQTGLPQTGEDGKGSTALSLLGLDALSMLGLIGLADLRRQRKLK